MLIVKKKPNETDESLIRRFQKEVFFSGLLDEVKKSLYFVSGAEKRKLRKKRIAFEKKLEKKYE